MGIKRVLREENEASIGRAIRAARKTVGMTQTQLGQALGVTYQQVQNYEKGTVRVAASTLREISIILQRPIADFFEPTTDAASLSEHGKVDEGDARYDGH